MPLPPALAARLKKRGLLKQVQNTEPDEEIIAEDYSGETENEPPESQELQILINNTNLPSGWWKVKDPQSGYFYYWDSETDKVLWTPPEAPAEPEIPSLFQESGHQNVMQPIPLSLIGPMVGPIVIAEPKALNKSQKMSRYPKKRDDRDSRRRRRKEDDTLDPMDPSSYSDVARGSWSAGLPMSNEAKTGVDTTAVGPLFQMRPYPSPGAILRANAVANKKDD